MFFKCLLSKCKVTKNLLVIVFLRQKKSGAEGSAPLIIEVLNDYFT